MHSSSSSWYPVLPGLWQRRSHHGHCPRRDNHNAQPESRTTTHTETISGLSSRPCHPDLQGAL